MYWKFARLELRSQVLTCSPFMLSWLVMTWSMTMTVLPHARANSKPHDYKKSTKNEGPAENMGFNGETV